MNLTKKLIQPYVTKFVIEKMLRNLPSLSCFENDVFIQIETAWQKRWRFFPLLRPEVIM